MSELIYKGEVRSALGAGEVRITDTDPGVDTPDLYVKPPAGGIRLQMGDTGQASNDLPTSTGSFFTLQFQDRPNREFQDLFRPAFSESRFEVELDVPGVGLWRGFVKSELQQRPLARRTRAGAVSITCYDGLASLSSPDPVNATAGTVTDFLETAFAAANPDLDIIAYVDLEATDLEGNAADLRSLVPVPGEGKAWVPRGPTPSQGQGQGLGGGSLRGQLDSLCRTFTASAYYDVAAEAWAFVDIAAIGAPVTGLRYDGSTWQTYTFQERTVQPEQVQGAEILDGNDDRLRTLTSAKSVCVEVSNWITDPGFEATINGDDLVFWDTNEAKRNANGHLENTGSNAGTSQRMDLSDLDIFPDVDVLFLESDDDVDPSNVTLIIDANYSNGDNDGAQSLNTNKVYFELDKQNHDGLKDMAVDVRGDAGAIVKTLKLVFLQKLTDEPVDIGEGDNNRYREIERICFKDRGKGRASIDANASGLAAETSGGLAGAAKEWASDRYDGPFNRLWLWSSTNLLALKPPGYERLKGRMLRDFAPLGTRIRWSKPGEEAPSTFVPLKGRSLHLGTENDLGTGTEFTDVEIPDAVIDRLPA